MGSCFCPFKSNGSKFSKACQTSRGLILSGSFRPSQGHRVHPDKGVLGSGSEENVFEHTRLQAGRWFPLLQGVVVIYGTGRAGAP